jgi:hypothetical protein
MKRLYRQYLNLRVWFLRRRLRQMGFRDVPDQKTAETLVRLQMEPSDAQRLLLDFIKFGLMAAAVASIGLIVGLRLAEPVQIILPRLERPPSSPSFPDTIAPAHRNFKDPTIHIYTA